MPIEEKRRPDLWIAGDSGAAPLRWTGPEAAAIVRALSAGTGLLRTFFLQFFTWWHGQTLGTKLWTRRFGQFVGEDEHGNRYFRTPGKDPTIGVERRWVVYNGLVEASKVPPGWNGWLHNTVELAPSEEAYAAREWQRPHIPNLTGTPLAWRPPGSTQRAGERPPATGDYEAWRPES